MLTTVSGNEIKLMFGTGLSSVKEYEGLKTIIKSAIETGIFGFDTAPSYGTEEVLGKCISDCLKSTGLSRDNVFIQTKIDAWQMLESKESICKHIENALTKLGVDYIDSLLVHWPVPEHLDKTWECFIKMKNEGKIRNIGICNLRMRHLVHFDDYIEVPSIIQLERNPLCTFENEVSYCKEKGIAFQSYSPLCKMHPNIANSQSLSMIAKKYNKNIGQIVLRWHIETHSIPIFTSKKTSRIKEYAELFNFSLNEQEINSISSLNHNYKMYLEACACPGY